MFLTLAIVGIFLLLTADLVDGHSFGFETAEGFGTFWSPRVIGGFLTGFGCVGFYFHSIESRSLFSSSMYGVLFGILLSGIVYVAVSLLTKAQSNSIESDSLLVGSTGIMTLPVSPKFFGTVAIGKNNDIIVQSRQDIPAGEIVKVIGSSSGILEVSKLS